MFRVGCCKHYYCYHANFRSYLLTYCMFIHLTDRIDSKSFADSVKILIGYI